MGFRQQLWGKFSKSTELDHITSEHKITCPEVSKTVKYGTETI